MGSSPGGKPEEVLVIIEHALELDERSFNNWNVKAIILEDMARYGEAIEYYGGALVIVSYSKVVKNNKSYSLPRLAYLERFGSRNWQKALDFINDALKLQSDDEDKSGYLRIKANVLEAMGKGLKPMCTVFLQAA